MSDKWHRLLRRADANGDGVVDAGEVVDLVEELLMEQSMKRVYRFITLGLALMVVVLIGALSGITFGIVTLSKETKVSSFTDTSFQFLTTRDGEAAVSGGLALDVINGLVVHPDGGNRRHLLAGDAASSRRRLLDSVDLSGWTYFATLPYGTVAEGCRGMLQANAVEFPVHTPFSLFQNGTSISNVRVLQQTGCEEAGDVRRVSALLEADDGWHYHVGCHAEVGGCDLWYGVYVPGANATGGGNATSSGGRVPPTEDGGCFPADATVHVLGRRGAVRMSELSYGDAVRCRDRATGALVHRPVYLFGHKERAGSRPYVHLTVQRTAGVAVGADIDGADGAGVTAAGGGAAATLAATRGHFLPVCVAGCSAEGLAAGRAVLENRRAGDVRVGDLLVLYGDDDSAPSLGVVTHVDVLAAAGAYNPYVRGADLIVNGVLASPHSDWILDPIAPAWLVPYLPALYEALLAPVYGLYGLLGPDTAAWLAHGGGEGGWLGLAELGATHGSVYLGFWVALAAVAAAGGAACKRVVMAAAAK